jgi:hypothetical protein
MTNQSVIDVENCSLHAPSLLDAVALVIVIVVGVALRRYGWAGGSTRTWDYASHANITINGMHIARHMMSAASPVGFGLAVVAVARVLREPLPRRQRLFLQPGIAACVAFAATLVAGAASSASWIIRGFEFHEAWLAGTSAANILFNSALSHLIFCVLAVWAYLAFCGLWMRGRNWANRMGIALGVMAVIHNLLWCVP